MLLQIAHALDQPEFLVDAYILGVIDIGIGVKIPSGSKKGNQQKKAEVKESLPGKQRRLYLFPVG